MKTKKPKENWEKYLQTIQNELQGEIARCEDCFGSSTLRRPSPCKYHIREGERVQGYIKGFRDAMMGVAQIDPKIAYLQALERVSNAIDHKEVTCIDFLQCSTALARVFRKTKEQTADDLLEYRRPLRGIKPR